MRSWYEEAQNRGILAVAEQLGMDIKGKRCGPCPACNETSEKDDRPTVRVSLTKNKERERWFCQLCEFQGNVFDLVAYTLHGKAAGELPQFGVLGDFFSDDKLHELKKSAVKQRKLEYPPSDEVKTIIDASKPLYRVNDRRVIRWTKRRGLDIRKLKNGPRLLNQDFDYDGLTQVPTKTGTAPWFPKGWVSRYPIIIPLVDYRGNLKSIYGRSITTVVTPKCRAPIHYTTRNLFFVNKLSWEFLKRKTRPPAIWIVEGEMDYMSILQHDDIPVIGIRSGAIEHLLMLPWHITQTVVIGTDNDQAGNDYAKQIAERIYPAQPKRLQLQILKKRKE